MFGFCDYAESRCYGCCCGKYAYLVIKPFIVVAHFCDIDSSSRIIYVVDLS